MRRRHRRRRAEKQEKRCGALHVSPCAGPVRRGRHLCARHDQLFREWLTLGGASIYAEARRVPPARRRWQRAQFLAWLERHDAQAKKKSASSAPADRWGLRRDLDLA